MPLSRLPLKGDAGIAISPDGKRLAVGERIDQTDEAELAVSIWDRLTGVRLARIVHDHLRADRGDWVNSHFGIQGIQFTSDGKYLITSGTRTRVWDLAPGG
jgi:WD40 repeat protein